MYSYSFSPQVLILSKPQLHQPLNFNSRTDCARNKSFSQKMFVPYPHCSTLIKYYSLSSKFSTRPQAETMLFDGIMGVLVERKSLFVVINHQRKTCRPSSPQPYNPTYLRGVIFNWGQGEDTPCTCMYKIF